MPEQQADASTPAMPEQQADASTPAMPPPRIFYFIFDTINPYAAKVYDGNLDFKRNKLLALARDAEYLFSGERKKHSEGNENEIRRTRNYRER